MAENRKLRILCLHGYRQSAKTFHKKTGAFRKILGKQCEFVDITAPHKLDGVDENGEEIYSWFNYDKMEEFRTCTSYLGMEDTLAYLQKVFAEQGPFDGVLGFSQGGVLASILCGMRASVYKAENNNINFNFAIIISAFPTSVPQYRELYSNIEEDFPSLHSYGLGDTLIPPDDSRKLISIFPQKNLCVLEHPGGHYVRIVLTAATQNNGLNIIFPDRNYITKQTDL